MAEELEPTEALLALLRDVDDRRVRESPDDLRAYLHLDGGDAPADVAEAVWPMERAGWVWQPAESATFELTALGREVLDRGAP